MSEKERDWQKEALMWEMMARHLYRHLATAINVTGDAARPLDLDVFSRAAELVKAKALVLPHGVEVGDAAMLAAQELTQAYRNEFTRFAATYGLDCD
jgi:hypothetical protein